MSDSTTASYAYDALNRRIAKTVDGSVEAFVYDSWSLRPTGNDVILDFENSALARRWQHGTQVDEPLAVESYSSTTAPGTGALRSLFANRLGSIALAVSVATGAVAEAEYDSFGGREIVTGTESEMPRYGFTGREHDIESGLIYFRARHYDPSAGQFIQRDPIGFAAGDLNLYSYVENDPYNWTDPSGLASSSLSYRQLAIDGAVLAVGACAVSIDCTAATGGVLGGIWGAVQNLTASIVAKMEEWRENDDPPPPGHNGGPDDDDPDPEEPDNPFIPPWWPDDDQYSNPEEWIPSTQDPGSPEQNLPPGIDPYPTKTGGQKTLIAVRIIQLIQRVITGF